MFRGGTFDRAGYRHPHLDYQISALTEERILDSEWVLDNYRDDSFLRNGPEDTVHRRYDTNGDGRLEDVGVQPLDDLRFRSRRDAGVIWVRTLPLPERLATTELRVLMQLVVEGIAETGSVAASVEPLGTAVTTRTHSATMLDSQVLAVDGREAFAATIEVADNAQLVLDPTARTRRIRLVLLRTDFNVPVLGESRSSRGVARGLMMLGYSNLPVDFDRSLGHFAALVERVEFDTPAARTIASRFLACDGGDRVVAVVAEPFGQRVYAGTRQDDGDDRACIESLVRERVVQPGRSYGFRAPEARFSPRADSPMPTVELVGTHDEPNGDATQDLAPQGP